MGFVNSGKIKTNFIVEGRVVRLLMLLIEKYATL